MNLIDCDCCGAIFNSARIRFPDEDDYPNGLTYDSFFWTGEEFIPYISCPVCKEGKILSV